MNDSIQIISKCVCVCVSANTWYSVADPENPFGPSRLFLYTQRTPVPPLNPPLVLTRNYLVDMRQGPLNRDNSMTMV